MYVYLNEQSLELGKLRTTYNERILFLTSFTFQRFFCCPIFQMVFNFFSAVNVIMLEFLASSLETKRYTEDGLQKRNKWSFSAIGLFSSGN